MRMTLVTRGVPRPGGNGPALSLWSLVTEAQDRGHEVTVVVAHRPSPHTEAGLDLGPLAERGIPVEVVTVPAGTGASEGRGRLARLVRPRMADLYPWSRLGAEVGEVVAAARPDVIVAYEAWMVAALPEMETPVLAIVVDLDHLPGWLRFKAKPPQPTPRYAAEALRAIHDRVWRRRFLLQLLKRCDGVVEHAAHHARWLAARGVACSYEPMPVPNPGRSRSRQQDDVARILLVGHLRGTATLAGLHLFARSVLPALRQLLRDRRFQVRIVGAFPDSLPRPLAAALEGPEVTLTGYVEDIGHEFRSADVVLVPTPIELGTRVRILVALSYGCCVVAHGANARGIPELEDGVNVLLADDGKGLAGAVRLALDDEALAARIRAEARATYERHFSPATAGTRLIERITAAAPSIRPH